MGKVFSIVITVMLLCSCAEHTQRFFVPSKQFSMMEPPSDWKTLIKTELSESPIEPYEKIPGVVFTALWSKNNTTLMTLHVVAQTSISTKASLPGANDYIEGQALLRYRFLKYINTLARKGRCWKDSIDSLQNRHLDQGFTIYMLEASITCTELRAKSFFKTLLWYMFSRDGYLYFFELVSLQSDFQRDRQVLDDMIDSFSFIDEASEKTAPADATSALMTDEFIKQDQAVETTFSNFSIIPCMVKITRDSQAGWWYTLPHHENSIHYSRQAAYS